MSHACYLTRVFNMTNRRSSIKEAKEKIAESGVKFDAILVSGGVSGLFGAILSHTMRKRLVVVRKKNVSSHSTYRVENLRSGDRLLFIDDCVATAITVNHCVRTCTDQCKIAFVGAYLYDNSNKGGAFVVARTAKKRWGIRW